MSIEQFTAERNAALVSLDEPTIRAFARKYGAPLPPADRFWPGVHVARLEIASLSDEAKALSMAWLDANGWERCAATAMRPMGWRLKRGAP